jgi:uncharacterized protein YpuA (DUF1002 family)
MQFNQIGPLISLKFFPSNIQFIEELIERTGYYVELSDEIGSDLEKVNNFIEYLREAVEREREIKDQMRDIQQRRKEEIGWTNNNVNNLTQVFVGYSQII